MKPLRWMITALILATTPAAGTWGQGAATGSWHGALATPAGEVTIIVTLDSATEGTLQGRLEVPEQLAGQALPLTEILFTGGRLAFTVPSIGAFWQGEWEAGEQRWIGTWRQGALLRLDLARGLPTARPVVERLDGVWEGTIARNDAVLRLVVRISTGPLGTLATLDSPDLAAFGLPVAELARVGDAVHFHVPLSGARFAGVLEGGDTRLSGTWLMPGRPEALVTFTRAEPLSEPGSRRRPQDPREPFGYQAEPVRFANPRADGVVLAGTLTLPEGSGPFPAAVLISGSGPQDRDETFMGHRPFAVLADHLTRHGIAVLRSDDRGYAESTGDHATATSADFATDANAAVAYLLTRPEIDPAAIGLIGHSEGGMIGPIAALDNEQVAFLVMLAGPGTSTAQLLRSQQRLVAVSRGVSDDELARTLPVFDAIMAEVHAAADGADAAARVRAVLTPAALDALGAPAAAREGIAEQYAREWFRFFLRYDPAAVLSRLRIPVLALNGSLDQQVPADENLDGIRAALAGNPDATIRKLEGLNHLFQTARTGAVGEYEVIAETFSPIALASISDWILDRVGAFPAGRPSRP